MREFERITIDPQVNNGMACIRDTGITISEVVKKAVYEKSSAQVLVEYPQLTQKDIQETLEYAISDLIETIAIWKNEGLTPIITIQGYSELLLGVPSNIELTEEQKRQFLETTFHNSRRAASRWWNFSNWVYKTYRPQTVYWQPFSIALIVKQVLQTLPSYEPNAEVKIDFPENLPDVRADDDLITAIVNLLTYRTNAYLKLKSTVSISLNDNHQINFQIVREFEYTQSDLPIDRLSLGWSSSPLELASLILNEHESELLIHPLEKGVMFEFNLAIWHDSAKGQL